MQIENSSVLCYHLKPLVECQEIYIPQTHKNMTTMIVPKYIQMLIYTQKLFFNSQWMTRIPCLWAMASKLAELGAKSREGAKEYITRSLMKERKELFNSVRNI